MSSYKRKGKPTSQSNIITTIPANMVKDEKLSDQKESDQLSGASTPKDMGPIDASKLHNPLPNQSAPTLADPKSLHKIDLLFACNVGEYIDLPQLVVVGDQSSGKSSVLEGLVDLSFPRDKGLCTRFATQIVFQRNTDLLERKISASIIPGEGSTEEHEAATKAWQRSDLTSLDSKTFVDLLNEATKMMGVRTKEQSTKDFSQSTFSNDVLRLEISGPNEEHLSVIDVPGIFRGLTEGVTTKEDRDMVKEMVRSYMKNPRSLMLAVIPASVDIATQEILEFAKEFDGDGVRTLGILTKPDLVDRGGERAVIDLLEDKKHKLRLGWHVVRNLGQSEMEEANESRHAVEKHFFVKTVPWNTVPKDKCGIATLRTRLQELLAGHIRREFPKVKIELHKRLKDCEEALEALGPERSDSKEQASFLLNISMHFQEIVAAAVEARYGSKEALSENDSMKIATAVKTRSEKFSLDMQNFGHSHRFEDPNMSRKNSIRQSSCQEDPILVRSTEVDADIADILYDDHPLFSPENDIIPWLTKIYSSSRGFELGTFEPSLLLTTMKKQAANWKALSSGFISDIVTLAHKFLLDVLQHICRDDRLLQGIVSLLMDDLIDKYQVAIEQVNFALRVEMGTPSTVNHYFNDNLEKSRRERTKADAESKSFYSDEVDDPVVKLEDLTLTHPLSNKEHSIHDIHDILQAYYKVARKRFVDNVCMQGAEYHLITGPDTPLKLFSPAFVVDLNPEQLESVAGEDPSVKSRRAVLKKEIADLQAGKKILN